MKLSKRAAKTPTDDIEKLEWSDTPSVSEKIKESKQPIFPKGFYNIKEWDGSTDVVYLVPIVTPDNFAGYRMTYPDGVTNEISSSTAEELVVSPLSTVEATISSKLSKQANEFHSKTYTQKVLDIHADMRHLQNDLKKVIYDREIDHIFKQIAVNVVNLINQIHTHSKTGE